MNTNAYYQQLRTDSSHTIHLVIPKELGSEVEVFVFSRGAEKKEMPPDSFAMASLMDETGFVKNILNSPIEECWNDL
ncbi:MAG: hypothetical protein WCI23_12035 [Chlorobiaceae bacterium]|jgi:hypothetical protein